jgi:hypothetical protein
MWGNGIDETTLCDHPPVLHLFGDQDFSNLRSRVHFYIFLQKTIVDPRFAPKLRVRKLGQASILPVFAANRSPAVDDRASICIFNKRV